MGKLPITKNEYDKFCLVVNFLTEFKEKIKDNNNVENVIFTPQVNGYRITFDYSNIPCVISLSYVKNLFSVKMTVEYMYGSEKSKNFTSKTETDNQEILARLLVEHD